MNVKADDIQENNGTRVSETGSGNFQTRLGVKAFANMNLDEKNSLNRFTPFVEMNWVHNTNQFGAQLDSDVVNQAGAKNTFEMKVGANGEINDQLSIWGSLNHEFGQKSYKNTSFMIGAKYNF